MRPDQLGLFFVMVNKGLRLQDSCRETIFRPVKQNKFLEINVVFTIFVWHALPVTAKQRRGTHATMQGPCQEYG